MSRPGLSVERCVSNSVEWCRTVSNVSNLTFDIKVVSSIREFEGMGVCKVVFWVSFK